MASGTGLFCISSSMMLGCATLGVPPGKGGRVGGKFRSYGDDSIICVFFLAVPLVLIFSNHPLSIQHVCLDKGCLYLWWERAKYRGLEQCKNNIY